jgi:hypothetical protein
LQVVAVVLALTQVAAVQVAIAHHHYLYLVALTTHLL